ncbi:uncharacterized protein MEPE_04111 [Melanopsichium pennsylvanicum]|uniref:Uncharacterized protein n=2 Tax=Melanopsichium pennsylvanicum TaxID=63383 RepID=A0AAJ4XND8_9BASI|nr:uncharacterized protein BN887_02910 [Melanopsichium pennsylvanicum 4]SNX85402.1 uncharacterized protein MEPE_04111 [Melanopsichium pennsylvanicum]
MRTSLLVRMLILAWTVSRSQASGSGSRDFTRYVLFPTEDDESSRRGFPGPSSSQNYADPGTRQHLSPANHGSERYPVRSEDVSWHERLPSLPSDDELFHSMASARPPVSEEASGDDKLPWVPIFQEDGQLSHYQINRFDQDGREFGPFRLRGYTFESQPYPHDLPFLESINRRLEVQPMDFRRFLNPKLKTLWFAGSIYRPDPQMLGLIERTVKPVLARDGPTLEGEAKQGEFLWPPVYFDSQSEGLVMRREFREMMFRNTLKQVRKHFRNTDKVLYMPISSPQGTRHVMAYTVDPVIFTDMPSMSKYSSLWIFHEAVQVGNRHMLALLGSMYLPKTMYTALRKGGFAFRAWGNHLGDAPHPL